MYGSIFQDTVQEEEPKQTRCSPVLSFQRVEQQKINKTAIICEVRQSTGEKEETQKGKLEESYMRVPSSLWLSADLYEPEGIQDSGRITKEQLTKQFHKLT